MNKNKTVSRSIGFTQLLLLAFIVLKLCGQIVWSWWWVLAPIWIPFVLAILFFAFYGVISMIKDIEEENNRPKSKWEIRLKEMQLKQDK